MDGALRTRFLFGAIALVAILAYLVVVDMGISAGKIHHGVFVGDVDLGGLIERDAIARLERRADELKDQPIEVLAHGYNTHFTPAEVSWTGAPRATARRAMQVGRRNIPLGALADRVSAWLWGVKLEWAGKPRDPALHDWVVESKRRLACLGLKLDRRRLRKLVTDAVQSGHTGSFDFPVTGRVNTVPRNCVEADPLSSPP